MELAKIKQKGQIINSNSVVLSDFQKAMEGAAKEAGFNNPDDVTKYIKQLRKSNKK